MFFSESLAVDAPLAMVQHRLLTFLRVGDLDGLAEDAYGEGLTLLAHAGAGGLSKAVTVQSIPAYRRGAVTVVPIRWVATGPMTRVFPVLDANLELSAADAETTLTMVGTYRPPFGRLGEAIDKIALKSVASATIRTFLSQLSEVATQLVGSPIESHAGGPGPFAPGES
jgi:hypothetical protein